MTHLITAGADRIFPLTRDGIVERLKSAPPLPAQSGPHRLAPQEGVRITAAAVLVPLVNRDDAMTVMFTQRTAHLADHAGQICFPGGRVEATDASREDTALRETEEEVGLPRSRISLLGRLPDYEIPSGFHITPVVGWIDPPFVLQPDAFEVAEVFEAPLDYFLDPLNYQRRQYHFRGRHRQYMAIPYNGRYIWGATADMLYSLCRKLRD